MHDMTITQHHELSYVIVAEGSQELGSGATTQWPGGNQPRHALIGLPALARRLYEFGQRRTRFLPAGLFGEPAWYILLDLYASEAEGRAISLTSASVASGAPPTTGLRMIRILEDKGLVSKEKVCSDKRRCDVNLTPLGRSAIEQTLREVHPMIGHVFYS